MGYAIKKSSIVRMLLLQIILTSSVFGQNALKLGQKFTVQIDKYKLGPDKHKGGYDGDAQPKIDLNDGKNGDNPYFRRHNVARAWNSCGGYWFTVGKRFKDEPDPRGEQWVDYKPPLNKLGCGQYEIIAYFRGSYKHRAKYGALYTVYHTNGKTSKKQSQKHSEKKCDMSVNLGTFNLGCDGYLRVEDTGSDMILFQHVDFIYKGGGSTNISKIMKRRQNESFTGHQSGHNISFSTLFMPNSFDKCSSINGKSMTQSPNK